MFGNEIKVGDVLLHATRDGSCGSAMRVPIVTDVGEKAVCTQTLSEHFRDGAWRPVLRKTGISRLDRSVVVPSHVIPEDQFEILVEGLVP